MSNIFQEHKKGLYLLFLVEMWERFSFYGMRALLVLYMIQVLLYSSQKAGNIYGLYTGLVYLTPLIGGYIADRYLGQRKCITLGSLIMTIGLFILAFCGKTLFIPALILMIIANGFFKSNISSVLGLLYENESGKKDSAFTIFYLGINLGAFLSPLVCGTLAVKYGFEYGFAAAGFGMIFGFLLYKIYENKLLGNCGNNPSYEIEKHCKSENDLGIEQKNQLKSLLILMLFTIPFWICFEQAGSSLTLFAHYQTNRIIFGHEIPTGYFQSLNPLFIMVLAPIFSELWQFLRCNYKEPTSVEKFVIALFVMSGSYILISLVSFLSNGELLSPLWLIVCYFLMTIAELCLSPIGLSLVSKLAPKKFLSLLMGCWFLTSFVGNLIAGFAGGKYGTVSSSQLFFIFACLSFLSACLLELFVPYLNKSLQAKHN